MVVFIQGLQKVGLFDEIHKERIADCEIATKYRIVDIMFPL